MARKSLHRDVSAPDASGMTLGAVGVSPLEESLYRALLDRPGVSVADLARVLDIAPARLRQALAELEDKGLVSRAPGRTPSFTAARPELALESLVLRRIADLEQVRREASRMSERFSATAPDVGDRVVEVVTGYDATLHWALQIQYAATAEVRLIDVPPPLISPVGPNPAEIEMLSRGVAYKVLYHESTFDVPGKLDAARACIASGEQARVYSGYPIKLIIADRSMALTYDPSNQPIQDSLIVHPSFLLGQLVMLFDLVWSEAVPLRIDGTRQAAEPDIDSVDRQILSLLATGAKDDRIARQLGMGLRSVRRRVSRLMVVLGARTRFQAGAKAAKLELI